MHLFSPAFDAFSKVLNDRLNGKLFLAAFVPHEEFDFDVKHSVSSLSNF